MRDYAKPNKCDATNAKIYNTAICISLYIIQVNAMVGQGHK